jgi:hypothetical protein
MPGLDHVAWNQGAMPTAGEPTPSADEALTGAIQELSGIQPLAGTEPVEHALADVGADGGAPLTDAPNDLAQPSPSESLLADASLPAPDEGTPDIDEIA